MDKNLHIVCHDVPYPVDYGGVFDLFYKIKALHKAGVKIHLHCFEYGRGMQPELNKYCQEVNYYKRKKPAKGFSLRYPYIVFSRADELLITRLKMDDYPILLEGIHCTWFLHQHQLTNRKVLVRLHNVEYMYYKELAGSTDSLFKKIYYRYESFLLKPFEKEIASLAHIIAVSKQDAEIYTRQLKAPSVNTLPVFLPYQQVHSKEGMGTYCLYHGNLSVAENERAVIWLLRHVFNKIAVPFVIAGKNPSNRLLQMAHLSNTTCLVANPGEAEMTDLIQKAHIHILPSCNNTGVKLKLINALFNGRHCIVNDKALMGTDLGALCHVTNSAKGFQSIITQLYHQPFTEDEIKLREHLLHTSFNNDNNARKLIQWLY